MQIEKKLIICSILAVAIGILTVTPLAFLMTPATAQSTDDQPKFSFDVPYAYVRNLWDNSTLTNDTDGAAFSVGFETSPNFDLTDELVAYYETYRGEICADGVSIGNITMRSFAISPSGINENNKLDNITAFIQDWCNIETDDYPTYIAIGGWSNGTSQTFKNGHDNNWTLTTGQPESLTMKIYLENSMIRTLNSTQIILNENPEPLMQLELTRYRDGYLYNTAFPQQELDQFNPLFPMRTMMP